MEISDQQFHKESNSLKIPEYQNDELIIKNKFFESISNNELHKISEYVKEDKLPFWNYKENDGSTALVKSVFLNMSEISCLLIETAKQRMNSHTDFVNYLNLKGDNGFNALHYAAFRGNLRLIEKLIHFGADINIKNNSGLNVMHMAAQGDQPNAIVFFKEKLGIKISSLDSVMSTPLHWASYMGAESSVDYLTSWELDDINASDKDGFTPLHLAVMTGNILIY
jgi:ankyrin repeat protein